MTWQRDVEALVRQNLADVDIRADESQVVRIFRSHWAGAVERNSDGTFSVSVSDLDTGSPVLTSKHTERGPSVAWAAKTIADLLRAR